MRYLLSLLFLLPACATDPLKVCVDTLAAGDKITMFSDGKRFECERMKHEKAPDPVGSPVPADGLRPNPGVGADGWL